MLKLKKIVEEKDMVGKYMGFMFIAFWGLFAIFSPIAHAASLFDYNMNLSKEDFTGIIIMEIGQERFFVNGNEASGDKPFVEYGRTMAPLRTIGEAFGAKVDWTSQDNKVTVMLNSQKLELFLGSKNMYVNGAKKELDVAAKTYSGRTCLPLRAIGEALGKSVSYIQDYNLIIIAGSPEWIENYDYNSYYTLFSWVIEGKKILYADNILLVYYKNDGELYLKNWGSGISEYHFKSYNPYEGAPCHWYNISGKEYLVFHNEPEGAPYDYIYLFKDGKLKLIYSEAIFDIKFTNDYMYILVSGPGIDQWFAVDEHSNLLKLSLQDYSSEYIGVKGYVYGCILKEGPIGSFTAERDNWQIKDDGIYISGFYSLGTSDFKEKRNNTGRYKVSLTSQSHEKLTP